MFESIGFDGPGIQLQDSRASTHWTFKGHNLNKFEVVGPSEGCTGTGTKRLGNSAYARLALRAILPTYFRHSYTEGTWQMIKHGVAKIVPTFLGGDKFSTDFWKA